MTNLLNNVPKGITLINKKLVILFAASLVSIIVIAVTLSFSGQKKTNPNTQVSTMGSSSESEDLSQLPSSYGDANKINRYLDQAAAPSEDSQLKKALNDMKAQQQALRAEMDRLKNQKPEQPAPVTSQVDSEILKYPMFVNNMAPHYKRNRNNSNQQKAGNSKATGQNKASSSENKETDYEKANGQDQKESFFKQKVAKDFINQNMLMHPISKYTVNAGSVINAVLDTTINTDQPGMIRATVSRPIYDTVNGTTLLIPQGTKVLGKYNSKITYGQERVQVSFQRLVFPNGNSIVLPNEAGMTEEGTTGLTGDVHNHWGQIIGAGLLSAVFNVPALIAMNSDDSNDDVCLERDSGGSCNRWSSGNNTANAAKQGALEAMGQSASNIGNKITERSLNLQPTIIAGSGTQFSIMVNKDLILEPYTLAGNYQIP